MIELIDICFERDNKKILNNINLKLDKNKFYVITGQNGSGKSTLVKIIMGIIKPDSGKILLDGEDITNFLSDVFDTWNNEILPPKLHFSTPREFENDRRHADYIDAISFIEFLEKAKEYNRDIDIMLECKEKDEALHKLREDIKVIRPQYTWLDESTIEI